MKPDWDKLASQYNDSDLVTVADVDCTTEGKAVCTAQGIRGYPTIKYWLAGDDESKDYKGGRSFSDLETFVKKTFAKPCDVKTQEHCDAKQKEILDSYKGKDAKAEHEAKTTELKNTESDLKALKKKSEGEIKDLENKIKHIKTVASLLDKLKKTGHDEL